MAIGNPIALYGLLLFLPIVAIFLLRRRPVPVEVPSIELWCMQPGFQESKWMGRRITKWLTLLVQLFILLLLVLTLADLNPARDYVHFIIVLDDSGTMQTRTEHGTRFDQAREQAIKRIKASPKDARFTLVLGGESPYVPFHARYDSNSLMDVLREMRPRDVNSDINAALNEALKWFKAEEPTRLVVLTDTPQSTSSRRLLSEAIDAESDVEWTRIDYPRPNAGIADLAVMEDGSGLRVTIAHNDMKGTATAVRMITEGEVVGRQDFVLDNETIDIVIPASLDPGRPFTVRLECEDALMLDNVAYGVWPRSPAVRVRVATSGNIRLLAALRQPHARVEVTTEDELPNPPYQDVDVVVLDSPTQHITSTGGRFLVLGGIDPFGLCDALDANQELHPTHWATQTFLADKLDLLSWSITRTASFGASDYVAPIVSAGNTPLILASVSAINRIQEHNQSLHVTYFNFELADSNLTAPGSYQLPLVIWRAINLLMGHSDTPSPATFATGGRIRSKGLGGSEPVVVRDPNDRTCSVIFDSGELTIFHAWCAGFYAVDTTEVSRPLAVSWLRNALPVDGPSDVADASGVIGDSHPTSASFGGSARSRDIPQETWKLLVLLAACLILVETWLFYRGTLKMT